MAEQKAYWELKWEFVKERRRLLRRKLIAWIAVLLVLTAGGTWVFFHTVMGIAAVRESSMVPAYQNGSVVLYRRGTTAIAHGSIIVFRMDGTDYIKRVIAVPGDVVNIPGDGSVYRNGVPLDEAYVHASRTLPKGGAVYPLTVPEGYLFVMGDNREVSLDSRSDAIGLVPLEAVQGSVRGGDQ